MTNDRLLAYREAMRSPSGPGAAMSRRELADAVNEYLRVTTGRAGTLGREQVWRWERGLARWPGKRYREALRAILGAESDTELGFVRTVRSHTGAVRLGGPVMVGDQRPDSAMSAPGLGLPGGELIVLALIRHEGRLLVVRDVGIGRVSLPGGRVGDGTPVQGSLERHVTRQTGLEVTVGGFAGGVEQHHGEAGDVRHVVSLVFEARVSGALVSAGAAGRGARCEVQWVAVEDLARHGVQPVVLRDALTERADGPFWRART